jgi:hypothetical protein
MIKYNLKINKYNNLKTEQLLIIIKCAYDEYGLATGIPMLFTDFMSQRTDLSELTSV